MIAYNIGVLPIIRDLQYAHPCITHPWYADDVRSGDSFGDIIAHLHNFQKRGPLRGYFPDPTKIILVLAL